MLPLNLIGETRLSRIEIFCKLKKAGSQTTLSGWRTDEQSEQALNKGVS